MPLHRRAHTQAQALCGCDHLSATQAVNPTGCCLAVSCHRGEGGGHTHLPITPTCTHAHARMPPLGRPANLAPLKARQQGAAEQEQASKQRQHRGLDPGAGQQGGVHLAHVAAQCGGDAAVGRIIACSWGWVWAQAV